MSILCATMLMGMVSMAMRISVQSRNQRADQDQAVNEAREAMDTIERLVGRAVELQEWDANTNTPELTHASGEGGDSYTVNVTGTGNMGPGPNVNANAGEIISHDGTRWSRTFPNPVQDWDPTANSPALTPPLHNTGDVMRVVGVPANGAFWVNGAPPGQMPVPPPDGRWYPGEMIMKRNLPGPGGPRWYAATWRASTNWPPISDATGAVGDVYRVVVPRPVPAPPPIPVWTPTATVDLGSGPLHLAQGDVIVKTPYGWRKLGYQNAIKNFKSATTGRDDDVSGIHFFADVDPPTPIGSGADLDNNRKILEWVWIWWDRQVDADLTTQPYDRRGPLKVAIFRAQPSGNVGNEHDTWTRSSHPLFNLITRPTQFRRAYHTTAGSFGSLQLKVQTFAAPVNRSCQQITWAKRVAVTGGVFADRTGEFAAMGTNPWDDVAPGARFVAGAPGRFTNVPSYTFCRSIYAANAGATTDDQNRPFTFNPNIPNSLNRMRRASVGWQTRFAAGNVKNDYVVQPR